MAQSFRQRSTQPELMDMETVGFAEFHDCLRDLATINMLTLAYRPTLRWLKHMLDGAAPHEPITVFDIGSGGGDMLRKIWQWARARHLAVRLTGIDLNPWSKRSSELVTPADAPIDFETINLFAIEPERRADFIISSLFTHHLTPDELVRFIRWMDRHAARGWFINDLHRHPLPFYFIRYAVRLLFSNRLIRHDAPVSVARAFTADDWKNILAQAGIPASRVRIQWFFPFRYCVACRKA